MLAVFPVHLSVYADDISGFITSESDIQALCACLQMYEQASSAHIRAIRLAAPPIGRQWGTSGIKVLGFFFGSELYLLSNWEVTEEKVQGCLQKMVLAPS